MTDAATIDVRRGSSVSDPVRAALEETMELDGWPAGLVAVKGQGAVDGDIRILTAGVAALGSPEPVRADSQIRIGSSTKTFTAAIVMQLVEQGRVALDDAVETHLPGVLRHPELRHGEVTLRHLLQHTSGLPDMSHDIFEHLSEWQHRYISPRASLNLALTHPLTNPPGQVFHYSNANYILAGLIIEAVSGRPFAEEVQRRLLTPVGLRDTYLPEQGEQVIRGVHPRSYLPIGEPPVDYTDFDPSWGYSAGAMVSTVADLTRFFSALAQGAVVPAAQLEQMRQTIPAAGESVPDGGLWEGAEYGLGLIPYPLSSGEVAWGHGGEVPGTTCRVAATVDGRAAAVVVTRNAFSEQSEARLRRLVETAICAG